MNAHSLHGLRVLVSGADVAGPAVAHWLAHYGAETTVVEIAPALRTSGFAVDFRGDTHLGVLAEMDLLDKLRTVRTHGGAMSFVDEHDSEIFALPKEFAGGYVEVLRRDLSRILYEHTKHSTSTTRRAARSARDLLRCDQQDPGGRVALRPHGAAG